MKKEQLEDYRSKKEEIKELQYKLEHLGEGDTLVGNSTIMDYRSGYPVPYAVVATDRERYYRLKNMHENKIEKLEKECEEVELFVENIENSVTRRIFRMHYIDCMTQKEIGKRVHMERSNVSIQINKFLKDLEQLSHNSHDSHL